jgi:nitrite reductase/ring-hydroxylating ferredoxin subunit
MIILDSLPLGNGQQIGQAAFGPFRARVDPSGVENCKDSGCPRHQHGRRGRARFRGDGPVAKAARELPSTMPTDAVPHANAITVALTEPFAPETVVLVKVGPAGIAVFNLDGVLHAIEDPCMRCGASLAAGTRRAGRVECGCGWTYDIASGAVDGLPKLRLQKFDVKREGDSIVVGRVAH